MSVVAAVLAAGKGERFGADKLGWRLRGRPVWRWSYDALRAHPMVDAVGIVATGEGMAAIAAERIEPAFLVAGGTTRQDSSRAAVEAMPGSAEIVLIHDAARPFVSERLIGDVIEAARRSGAAAPAVPIRDTVRRMSDGQYEVLDRAGLLAMQTPQGFEAGLLRRALAQSAGAHSDDVALVEAIGVVPELIPGEDSNFKITTPEDAERARRWAGAGEIRTGIGYDAHAFAEGPRPLMLGGVAFEDHRGLEGHSDADVLLHAIVDALLGAAALGDIGQHFPPSDERWKDRASSEFVRFAADLLNEGGWRILSVDATVIAESPRIMSRAADIRLAISKELRIPMDRVSVKATTNERMGSIGRGEGIAAFAIATIAGR